MNRDGVTSTPSEMAHEIERRTEYPESYRGLLLAIVGVFDLERALLAERPVAWLAGYAVSLLRARAAFHAGKN